MQSVALCRLVALGFAVGAGAKSENKKSTRIKATATETKSKRTADGKQEEQNNALCFAGADDAPVGSNSTHGGGPIAKVGGRRSAAPGPMRGGRLMPPARLVSPRASYARRAPMIMGR